MQLYEERGIVSYNLGSSAQPLELSELLLEEAYKTQSPSLVMLDVSSLFLTDFTNNAWRVVMDHLPWDEVKLEAAKRYAQAYVENQRVEEAEHKEAEALQEMVRNQQVFETEAGNEQEEVSASRGDNSLLDDVKRYGKAYLSAFSPLYNYHSRWTELTDYDVSVKNEATYMKGFYITSAIAPLLVSIETMNVYAEEAAKRAVIRHKTYSNGLISTEKTKKQVYLADIPEENLEKLAEIREYCEKHGSKLVLIKIPAIYDPRRYASAWTRLRSQAVKEMAQDNGLEFLDLLYDETITLDIDWNTFSHDGGQHCNYRGAKAVTKVIGEYLIEECGIASGRNIDYDNVIPYYDDIIRITELQMTQDVDEYLSLLSAYTDRFTILMAVNGDASAVIGKAERKLLKQLGTSLRYKDSRGGYAYIAVLENGVAAYEEISNEALTKDLLLKDGQYVTISSVGSLRTAETVQKASIVLDGQEYAINGAGLNIVVLDRLSGLVVDRVVFNGNSAGDVTATRRDVRALLKEYEHWQYEGYKSNKSVK